MYAAAPAQGLLNPQQSFHTGDSLIRKEDSVATKRKTSTGAAGKTAKKGTAKKSATKSATKSTAAKKKAPAKRTTVKSSSRSK